MSDVCPHYRKEHTNSNNIIEADSVDDDSFSPPVYNFVSSHSNPMTWGEFSSINQKYGSKIPSVKSVSNESFQSLKPLSKRD